MSQEEKNQAKPSSELDLALSRLSVDQIRFIVARQEHVTDKEAAEAVGLKPDRISQWKYRGVPIDEAVRLMAADGLTIALHVRKRNVAKAMMVKVAGLDDGDARLRQGVATEIIEWEMGKAKQEIDLAGSLDIQASGVLTIFEYPSDDGPTDSGA